MEYVKSIYSTRYLWYHLALSELRTKYRRSKLGMLWALLYPLSITVLLSAVMGRIFKSSSIDYMPFVFSGTITWDFLISSITNGCQAFVNSELYIKQCKHPLIIYPLKQVLAFFINYFFAFCGLAILLIFFYPKNLLMIPAVLIISMPLMLFFVWPLATISAFIGVVFRDFQQLITIMMTALWYVSPVFIQPDVFYRANLHFIVDNNPIFHFLELIRAPLLRGQLPSLTNVCFVIGSALFFWLIAAILIKTKEKKVIFFL